MKIINGLSGTLVEANWAETRGVVTAVHDEPTPGLLRLVSLGAAGITVRRVGGPVVGIPLAEIIGLAERLEPGLKAVKDAPKAAASGLGKVAALAGLLFLALAQSLFGQVSVPRGYTALPATNILAGTSFTNSFTNDFYLYKDRGFSMALLASTTNTTVLPVTMWLQVTADGTNWSTDYPFTWAPVMNNSNVVYRWTNVPPNILENARRARLKVISNATPYTVSVSNVMVWIVP